MSLRNQSGESFRHDLPTVKGNITVKELLPRLTLLMLFMTTLASGDYHTDMFSLKMK